MTDSVHSFLRYGPAPKESFSLQAKQVAQTLDAAYLSLADAQNAEPARWKGWKLGGTNHASRRAFGVEQCYYGAIEDREILAQPAIAPGFALAELKGEVEVALRLDATLRGFDAWCVALEMPSSPILNLVELGVIALVSDRCAAGALVLGPTMPMPMPDLTKMRFAQRVNGILCAEADMSALVAGPDVLLADFMDLAQAHAAPVQPGHWVATGGITPCLSYVEGDRVQILMDEAVVLDLVIKTD